MDGVLEALIAAACVAGAYSQGMRERPDLVGGWTKKYDQWHQRTAALAAQVARAGEVDDPPAIHVRGRGE